MNINNFFNHFDYFFIFDSDLDELEQFFSQKKLSKNLFFRLECDGLSGPLRVGFGHIFATLEKI